jgi:hypothetical protein
VIVAMGVSFELYFSGILPVGQALGGFGDLTVVLIGSLFVVASGREASGVTTCAGQWLIKQAGESCTRLAEKTSLLALEVIDSLHERAAV